MHGGVVGAVSGDDDVLGEPDGETGGDDGVGWMGQVICIYPYVPLISSLDIEPRLRKVKGYRYLRQLRIATQREIERRMTKQQQDEQAA